jgi:hypothetical protein
MPLGPRRTARALRGRRPRRSTTWITTTSSGSLTQAAPHINIDLWAGLEVAGASAVGLTLLRTLVQYQIGWGTAAATSQLFTGLIVDDKDLVGATPDLASNTTKDWYWWTDLFPYTLSGTTISSPTIYPSDYKSYDIRSRRRTSDMGRTSLLCMTTAAGATTQTYQVLVRQLVALP